MIRAEPVTAIASGGPPARIAGSTKPSRIAKLTASPASEARPRHRPNATIAAANATTSQISGEPRWWSAIVQTVRVGSSAEVSGVTITASPGPIDGAPGPEGSSVSTVDPSASFTVAAPHGPGAGPSGVGGQTVSTTAVTVACRRGTGSVSAAFGTSWGQSRIVATPVARNSGTSTA